MMAPRLRPAEVVVPTADARPQRRVGRRVALAFIALLLSLIGATYYGRWTVADRFDSGILRSTLGTGTESGGGEGPFNLFGRDARLTWSLDDGVDRIQVAVISADTGPGFAGWPEDSTRASDFGGTEFATSDRNGSWSLASLAPGDYWVRYEWSTRGGEPARWTYRVEQQLPWWRQASS